MPTSRKRKKQSRNPEINTRTNADPTATHDKHPTCKMSDYEQSRRERIKENLERMQKLGLADLSQKLKSSAATSARKRIPRQNPAPSSSSSSIKHVFPMEQRGPPRRSSRLQNVTPVSYLEAPLAKKDGVWEDEDPRLLEGSKPEVYTEEHEKLLGNTERTWTLFVDGCGKDGKRIYDQVNGKTCHQCRQKTLGYRTRCSECNMVQGQFCGDCLYMRYGEHVLEAIENPNWVCPVCRGICNCSLCRQAKGWHPTGTLYRKISSLGYKSVAHYLIQTRRSRNKEGKDSSMLIEGSTRRSLPFSDMEVPINESSQVKDEEIGALEHQSEDKTHNDLAVMAIEHESEEKLQNDLTKENQNQMPSRKNPGTCVQTKRSLPFSGSEAKTENMQSAEVNHEVQNLMHKFEEQKNEFEVEERKLVYVKKEQDDSIIAVGSCPKLNNNPAVAIKPSPDSIATRLRNRSRRGDGYDEKAADAKQAVNNAFDTQEVHEEKEMHINEKKDVDGIFGLDSSPKLKRKPPCATEPSSGSIGSRVRQRRKMNMGHNADGLLAANEKTSEGTQTLDSVSCNSHDDAGLARFNEKSPDAKLAANNIFFNQRLQKENEKHVTDEKHSDSITVLDSSAELKRKVAAATPPTSDSIGSRIRQKRKTEKGHFDDEIIGTYEQTSEVWQAFNRISFNSHIDTELGGMNHTSSDTKQAVNNGLFDQGVLKGKGMLIKDDRHADSIIALGSSSKLRESDCPSQRSSESIGSRVRQRHNLEKGQRMTELLGTREQTSEFGLPLNGSHHQKKQKLV